MSKKTSTLSTQSLDIDLDAEVEKISGRLREILSKTLRKRGLVVAISGGIDSSVGHCGDLPATPFQTGTPSGG